MNRKLWIILILAVAWTTALFLLPEWTSSWICMIPMILMIIWGTAKGLESHVIPNRRNEEKKRAEEEMNKVMKMWEKELQDDIARIHEPPITPLASPPREEYLVNYCRDDLTARKWHPIKMKEAKSLFVLRPTLTPETFSQYWPTKREAEIAWYILRIAREQFNRPPWPLLYPDDPSPLIANWNLDSLDSEEFIMALEEYFKIVISEADYDTFFRGAHTLRDMVHCIIEKQNAAKG